MKLLITLKHTYMYKSIPYNDQLNENTVVQLKDEKKKKK